MTPDEETLRDAFLAECWPVCREYVPPVLPSALIATAAKQGFASCHSCGVVFRQPRGTERPWELCADCVRGAA